MPSGAKKRKAAKKKKERSAKTIQSQANSQGNGDLKTHDEKGSDSGDLSSPTSQEHHHHPLAEAKESSVDPVVVAADNKAIEGSENVGDQEGVIEQRVEAEMDEVVQVESAFNSDEDSESRSVSIEHVECVEESLDKGSSRNGGSSSSGSVSGSGSSSSSDDELQSVENNKKNTAAVESEKLEEDSNPVAEMMPHVEPELVVSLSEEVSQVVEATPIKNVGNLDVIDLASKSKEDKLLSSLDENSGVSGLISLVLPSSDEKPGASGMVDLVLSSLDEDAGALGVIDLGSKENKDKLLVSSNVPLNVETSNGGEHSRVSDTLKCSENQLLLISSPPAVQHTSWKSCCGLFDIFMSSDR